MRGGAALVTGASSGIGAAVADSLADSGCWKLLLNGRDETRLTAVAGRTGGVPLPGDLAHTEAVEHLVRETVERAGGVDLLVASAGVGWAGPFAGMPLHSVDQLVAVDLTAVLRLVRLLLPTMIDRGSGQIVLIGSVAGAIAVREEAVYSAVKAGVAAFAESLRYELEGTGVTVSLVAPGPVDTPYFARRGSPYRRAHPRPVSPERVAGAVLEVIRDGRGEVYVPEWLRLASRLRGAAPGLFHRLATRFG